MKMELIEGSEMSAISIVTPGNYPKENITIIIIIIVSSSSSSSSSGGSGDSGSGCSSIMSENM